MKIGIDIRAIGQKRTGDEYYTLSLVRGLLEMDKKNQYFLLTNTSQTKEIEKKIFSNLNNKNAKVVSTKPKSKFFWTFFVLPRVAKRLKLDVLHVQYITPLWLPKKTKLVTTIADVSFKAFPEFINKIDLFFLNLLIPLSLRRANKVVAISKFTKKEILKYYRVSSEKVTVIHNGGAREIFSKKSKKKKEQSFNFKDVKSPYIFYIGTHQPRKDIPTLIEAFVDLKREGIAKNLAKIKNLQLIIGGKLKAHNYDSRIDSVLREIKKRGSQEEKILNDLIFSGFLKGEELADLYRNAEVFVFPSLYEGFGLPLIEAMCSETPVVCSDNECFQEIAGKSAKFYKAGDKNDLHKALTEVIIDSRKQQKMIQDGLKNAQGFSWQKTAKKMLEVFEEQTFKPEASHL